MCLAYTTTSIQLANDMTCIMITVRDKTPVIYHFVKNWRRFLCSRQKASISWHAVLKVGVLQSCWGKRFVSLLSFRMNFWVQLVSFVESSVNLSVCLPWSKHVGVGIRQTRLTSKILFISYRSFTYNEIQGCYWQRCLLCGGTTHSCFRRRLT